MENMQNIFNISSIIDILNSEFHEFVHLLLTLRLINEFTFELHQKFHRHEQFPENSRKKRKIIFAQPHNTRVSLLNDVRECMFAVK